MKKRSFAPGRGTLALAVALSCASTAALADTYTVTTSTTGSSGAFALPNLFPQGDIAGTDTYQLTVTGIFDSASIDSDPGRQWLRADNVDLNLSLRVGENIYSLQTVGQLSTQIFTDTDSDGNSFKRLYQSVIFDPPGAGNYARFEQYLFLAADQFAIGSVLEPATAYYADPIVKGFTIRDAFVDGAGSETFGEAAGRADTFNYQLAVAVPEPATWAMLAAGLALVGGAARRRQAARG